MGQGGTDGHEQTQGSSRRRENLWRQALGGVHFSAASGPGPSGMRPEHLKELCGVRNRVVAARVLKGIAALVRRAAAGDLPPGAAWLRDSRIAFLKKEGKAEPRPIRVGEVWRRLIGKGLIDDNRGRIEQFCESVRQFGIGTPGGAEALVHARDTVEKHIAGVAGENVVVIDVDLRNAFPSLEWAPIRDAIAEAVPGVAKWTCWVQSASANVHLPGGDTYSIDRGAEQGDPLGGLYCAAVLARVAAHASEAVRAAGGWVWDVWYMDDGQVVVPATHAHLYLTAFDEAAGPCGASRVADGVAKTVVREVVAACHSAVVSPGPSPTGSWVTEYIRASAVVAETATGVASYKVLGVEAGPGAATEQFRATLQKVREMHGQLAQLGDARAELVLQRVSLDVCRINHLLRARAPEIDPGLLAEFDQLQRHTISATLGGDIGDQAWAQAQLGVCAGGLGVRSAKRTAGPAHAASAAQARTTVLALFGKQHGEGVACRRAPGPREAAPWGFPPNIADGLAGAFEQTLDASARDWTDQLDPDDAAEAWSIIADVWERPQGDPWATAVVGEAHALVTPAGHEDDEARPRGHLAVQRRLCEITDRRHAADIVDGLEASGDAGGARLLRELRDPGNDHSWLWAMHPAHGACLQPGDYVLAARVRIGAPVLHGAASCALCGGTVDPLARHALCCATGTSTSGHNAVRDEVLRLAHLADGAAVAEAAGLITAHPSLRPADVLTSAARPGGLAAVDVGVVSPDASGRGGDACDAMVRAKRAKYAGSLAQLRADGVEYLPFVFSCYGRPHADAAAVLRYMAQVAARRQGFAEAPVLLARVRAAIGVHLWRRVAQMVRACVPPPAADSLLAGGVDAWCAADAGASGRV